MGGPDIPAPIIQQAPAPPPPVQIAAPTLSPGEQRLRELQTTRGVEAAEELERFRPLVGVIPEGRLEEIGRAGTSFESRLRRPALRDLDRLRQDTLESLGRRNILGGTEAAERLGRVGELRTETLQDISDRSIELEERFKSEELGRNLDRLAALESGVSVPSAAAFERTRLEQGRLSQQATLNIQQRQFEQDFGVRTSLAGAQIAAQQAAADRGTIRGFGDK